MVADWRIKDDHSCFVRSVIGYAVGVSVTLQAAWRRRRPGSLIQPQALRSFSLGTLRLYSWQVAGIPLMVALQRWSGVDRGTYSAHGRTELERNILPRRLCPPACTYSVISDGAVHYLEPVTNCLSQSTLRSVLIIRVVR